MPAIELHNVVKRFGAITAVDGLDLEVPEGICLGLLGPNGAGKSTTMRLLTGQAIADAGELRVLGHELPREAKAARAEMGVVPQLDNSTWTGSSSLRGLWLRANVEIGPQRSGWDAIRIEARQDFLGRRPNRPGQQATGVRVVPMLRGGSPRRASSFF